MHKNATKCNEIIGKWYKNKHGASKIIDTFETYQTPLAEIFFLPDNGARKILDGAVLRHPVGNPKRKV
jgi:hypothetical protein